MILSKKWKTKALIRLRGCAGWSAPVLFANPRRQVFSRRGRFDVTVDTVLKWFFFFNFRIVIGFNCFSNNSLIKSLLCLIMTWQISTKWITIEIKEDTFSFLCSNELAIRLCCILRDCICFMLPICMNDSEVAQSISQPNIPSKI